MLLTKFGSPKLEPQQLRRTTTCTTATTTTTTTITTTTTKHGGKLATGFWKLQNPTLSNDTSLKMLGPPIENAQSYGTNARRTMPCMRALFKLLH